MRIIVLLFVIFCVAQGLTVPQAHPRIWWNAQRLAAAKTWYNAHPFTPASDDYYGLAFKYIVMGDTASGNAIVNYITTVWTVPAGCATGISCDYYRWDDHVPVVFDWCYDLFTAQQRTTFIKQYSYWVEVMMTKDWGGLTMPYSNYFTGYMKNELNWAYAIWYENATAARTYFNFAVGSRWNNSFVPYANTGYGIGGVPEEGSEYGRATVFYPLISFITTLLSGRDLYADTTFFKGSVYWIIYSTTPSPTSTKSTTEKNYQVFPFGDEEHDGGYPTAAHEHYGGFMSCAAQMWGDRPVGQWARKWISIVNPAIPNYIQAVDAGGLTKEYNTLPLDYYAHGRRYLFTRNNWTPQATTLFIQLGKDDGGHGHFDAGNFQIRRNDAYLIKETTGYYVSIPGGVVGDTIAHNCLLIGRKGVSTGETNGPADVIRLHHNESFVYAAVNLTNVYRNNLAGPYPPAVLDNPYVKTVVREFAFIRSLETLVILDRIASNDVGTNRTFLLHFPTAPNVTTGTKTIRYAKNNNAVKVSTLYPPSPTFTIVSEVTTDPDPDYNQYRVEIQYSPTSTDGYFLHVITTRDLQTAEATATLTEDANQFLVTITSPNGQAIVVFQKGMNSVGGSIGISASGPPSQLTNFRTNRQGFTITDYGPVWEGETDPSPTSPIPTITAATSRTSAGTNPTSAGTTPTSAGTTPTSAGQTSDADTSTDAQSTSTRIDGSDNPESSAVSISFVVIFALVQLFLVM